MVHFTSELHEGALPEWRDHYVDYVRLKRLVSDIVDVREQLPQQPTVLR